MSFLYLTKTLGPVILVSGVLLIRYAVFWGSNVIICWHSDQNMLARDSQGAGKEANGIRLNNSKAHAESSSNLIRYFSFFYMATLKQFLHCQTHIWLCWMVPNTRCYYRSQVYTIPLSFAENTSGILRFTLWWQDPTWSQIHWWHSSWMQRDVAENRKRVYLRRPFVYYPA